MTKRPDPHGTAVANLAAPTVPSRWMAAWIKTSPDAARVLTVQVLGPILDCKPAWRAILLDTLAEWLTGASTQQIADRVYCSRNTVRARLHRVEQLTGRRMDIPSHVAELVIAVQTLRLLSADALPDPQPETPQGPESGGPVQAPAEPTPPGSAGSSSRPASRPPGREEPTIASAGAAEVRP